jgi:hypothetical protein
MQLTHFPEEAFSESEIEKFPISGRKLAKESCKLLFERRNELNFLMRHKIKSFFIVLTPPAPLPPPHQQSG